MQTEKIEANASATEYRASHRGKPMLIAGAAVLIFLLLITMETCFSLRKLYENEYYNDNLFYGDLLIIINKSIDLLINNVFIHDCKSVL